jgi:cysteinyl-tRNA synthetase
MGKSEGNAVNIHTLVDRWPAEALRLYYLQNHYRSPLPWDANAIPDALSMLARLYEASEVAGSWGGAEDPDLAAKDLGRDAIEVVEASRSFAARFFGALDEDFNTALAVSCALELARSVNRLGNHKSAKKRAGPIGALANAAFAKLAAIGLLLPTPEAFQAEVKQKRLADLGLDRDVVEQKLHQRTEARTARDWATADAIRIELDQMGVIVMDRLDGVDWRVRIA